MQENEMTAEESIATPLDIFAENYTYIGEDAEGYHHHADKANERIIVCDSDYQPVRDGWYFRLDPSEIDHVQDGLQYAPELERWADYVEQERGWKDRSLTTYPGLTQSLGDALNGGRA